MTYRMIYLVGAPGAGKSTLMARLTEDMVRAGHPDTLYPQLTAIL